MRKLPLFAALLTLPMLLSAQDVNFSMNDQMTQPSKQIFEGYFVIGCTIPTLFGDTQELADDFTYMMWESTGLDFDFKPGPRICPVNIGAGAGVNITSWAQITAGVEVVPKGMVYRGKVTDGDIDYKLRATYKFNYLEFPVGIRLSTRSWNNPDKTFFYVKAGVAPAINITSKLNVYVYATNGYDSDSDTDTEDFDGVVKSDLCKFIAVGVGKHKGTFFEVKYEMGSDLVMDPEKSVYEFYNRSVSLNLVVTF